jgi:transcriptional regulator of arginine metabolism
MYKRPTDRKPDETILNHGFVSLQFSENIAVIKTRPGYAGGMAYDIDSSEFNDILGTVAGDDTIILVLREGVKQNIIRKFLSNIISSIC